MINQESDARQEAGSGSSPVTNVLSPVTSVPLQSEHHLFRSMSVSILVHRQSNLPLFVSSSHISCQSEIYGWQTRVVIRAVPTTLTILRHRRPSRTSPSPSRLSTEVAKPLALLLRMLFRWLDFRSRIRYLVPSRRFRVVFCRVRYLGCWVWLGRALLLQVNHRFGKRWPAKVLGHSLRWAFN